MIDLDDELPEVKPTLVKPVETKLEEVKPVIETKPIPTTEVKTTDKVQQTHPSVNTNIPKQTPQNTTIPKTTTEPPKPAATERKSVSVVTSTRCPKCNTLLPISKVCIRCNNMSYTPINRRPEIGVSPVLKRFEYKPPDVTSNIPRVRDDFKPSSVKNRYNPVDNTSNIPIVREKWDAKQQSYKVVREISASSAALAAKPKFPKKGQGKPLRSTIQRKENEN